MGRKRRGSQAFTFEQTEETLMQNETIVKLYQNKTFLPPEQKEFETINEEGAEKTAQRVKRGQKCGNGFILLQWFVFRLKWFVSCTLGTC